MTKKLTFVLILFCSISFGQNVQIDTFKLKKSALYKSMHSEKMYFPIIRSGNKKIDSLINCDLKNSFTNNEYAEESLDSTLIKWSDEQIIFLDFEVTCNQKNILSINISAEGCGAYCTFWTEYFNYSILNGQRLKINDIIDSDNEFKTKVNRDRSKQYDEQKRDLKKLLNEPNGIDQDTYEWTIEYYDECKSNFNFESFSLYPNQLDIIDLCYLPNAIKCYSPVIKLNYKFSEINKYLKIKN